MKFTDIPKLTSCGEYQTDVGWKDLLAWLDRQLHTRTLVRLDLDPDFQRGRVWTEDQRIKYVEFGLRGGNTNNVLYFNCVGWMGTFKGPFVIVDGKQRLTAVRKFLENELKAFGHFYHEFEDTLNSLRPSFKMCINNLKTREEVLQWYLEMNEGGTPHTEDELERVRNLFELERVKNLLKMV